MVEGLRYRQGRRHSWRVHRGVRDCDVRPDAFLGAIRTRGDVTCAVCKGLLPWSTEGSHLDPWLSLDPWRLAC